jgi:hypothetical protein
MHLRNEKILSAKRILEKLILKICCQMKVEVKEKEGKFTGLRDLLISPRHVRQDLMNLRENCWKMSNIFFDIIADPRKSTDIFQSMKKIREIPDKFKINSLSWRVSLKILSRFYQFVVEFPSTHLLT